MKNYHKGSFSLLIIIIATLMLIITSGTIHVYSTSSTDQLFQVSARYVNLISHAPIKIENNDDLLSLVLDGSGSIDDPYLLQNFNLSSQSGNLIEVSNISFSLTIQNNFLNGLTNQNNGIVLREVSNVRIINNTITQTRIAIQLQSSSDNVIGRNTIYDNTEYAIELVGESNLNLAVWNNILQSSSTNSQAFDEGLQNVFQNNFWQMDTFSDKDGDQINDEPYIIDGTDSNTDLKPLTTLFDTLVHKLSPVQLLQPSPSEIRLSLINIVWTPSLDSHGHPITYSIFYSTDGDVSWILIADNLNTNKYSWNINDFEETRYSLKIEVLDDQGFTSEYEMASNYFIEEFVPIQGTQEGSDGSFFRLEGLSLASVLLAMLLVIGLGGYQIVKRILDQLRIKRIVEGVLGFGASKFLLQIISEDESEVETLEGVPPELLRFKYLLNPVRLGILKILFDYGQMAAYELRDLIGIPWGKFTPHIDSMADKGFVVMSSDFIDGKVRNVIFLEEQGRSQFMELQIILR
ncbi:MAG: right-handed parallel beta-helix repeat-containing protein, partial [Candidatus Heimdallarchaeota archaeon]|nr:right-handed parallel beta-helix repeat-containing protein [Candidatus Heimdallarchaeota archaeon]